MMLDILKNKKLYGRMVLSILPLLAVCGSLLDSLVAAAILVLTVVISAVALYLLRNLLNEKTSGFALLVISIGATGILSMIAELFASKQIVNLGIYIPLISLSVVFMLDLREVLSQPLKVSITKPLVLAFAATDFLIVSGALREFFGNGSILGFDVYSKYITPIGFLTTPAGGLFTAAVLVMIYNIVVGKEDAR